MDIGRRPLVVLKGEMGRNLTDAQQKQVGMMSREDYRKLEACTPSHEIYVIGQIGTRTMIRNPWTQAC